MSATAAWCAVHDMFQEAPALEPGRMVTGMRERVAFLEDKLRGEVELRLALEAEIKEWKVGVNAAFGEVGIDYPDDVVKAVTTIEEDRDAANADAEKAEKERDSARYVVETAGDHLSKGDTYTALVILQEDIASRLYEDESNQQDTLKRIAALMDAESRPAWVRKRQRDARAKR